MRRRPEFTLNAVIEDMLRLEIHNLNTALIPHVAKDAECREFYRNIARGVATARKVIERLRAGGKTRIV